MKQQFQALLLMAIAVSATSCATIVSKSSYPLSFTSTPSGANITVVNRSGNTVYTGSTPSMVTLKASSAYMKREEYAVTFQRDGHAAKTVTVQCGIDGWYFGNILLGGWLGMLIVDPLTGAMYKFDQTEIHADLAPKTAEHGMSLKIIDISQIPEGVKLVPID